MTKIFAFSLRNADPFVTFFVFMHGRADFCYFYSMVSSLFITIFRHVLNRFRMVRRANAFPTRPWGLLCLVRSLRGTQYQSRTLLDGQLALLGSCSLHRSYLIEIRHPVSTCISVYIGTSINLDLRQLFSRWPAPQKRDETEERAAGGSTRALHTNKILRTL